MRFSIVRPDRSSNRRSYRVDLGRLPYPRIHERRGDQGRTLGHAALKAAPKIGHANPKVLVPLAGAALLAGVAWAKGTVDTVKGRALRKEAQQRLDHAIAECEATRESTERLAREYGEFQIRSHMETVGRFADWLERNEHLVKRLNFEKVDGVRIRLPNIPKYAASVESVRTGIIGLASGVGAGVAAQAGALWGVSALASASTGTAISSLGGIAAQNATLAWLGGGSLAVGGGGVAAGGVVLSLVTIVPTLLVGGFTMGVVGTRSRTKSRGFAASVEIEIARIALAQDLLGAAERRIEELRLLLSNMAERATSALSALDALDFDPELHAKEFLRSYQLVTAVKEILDTPVLDPKSGELTEASIEILRKYA